MSENASGIGQRKTRFGFALGIFENGKSEGLNGNALFRFLFLGLKELSLVRGCVESPFE